MFDAQFDVLLYDPTSTYVEGEAELNLPHAPRHGGGEDNQQCVDAKSRAREVRLVVYEFRKKLGVATPFLQAPVPR